MEIGTNEGKPSGPNREISEGRIREFTQSLPLEGIILHGMKTTDIPGVKKRGLSPLGRNAGLSPNRNRFIDKLVNVFFGDQGEYVFYFFLKIKENPSRDEFSPKETRRIINALRLSINECLYYGDEPGPGGGIPAAIVLAKKPSRGLLLGGDHRPSMISRVQGALPIGASRLTIPSKDIMTVLLPSKDINSSRRERVDDMLKKIVDAVISWKNNSVKSTGNPVQKVMSRFSR